MTDKDLRRLAERHQGWTPIAMGVGRKCKNGTLICIHPIFTGFMVRLLGQRHQAIGQHNNEAEAFRDADDCAFVEGGWAS